MKKQIVRFLNLIMVSIVAGTIFGIWIGYNPSDLSAPTFIEQQQSAIKALNSLMPILGLTTIILTFISALLSRKEKTVFVNLLIASVFLVFSGLITKFGNQPINSVVMTWDMNTPPNNWISLRDQWWSFHILRTFTAFIALCLIVWTNMRKD